MGTRTLPSLQQACLKAIKEAELEMSGIRDGDSHWHDVLGAVLSDLRRAVSRLEAAYDYGREPIIPTDAIVMQGGDVA